MTDIRRSAKVSLGALLLVLTVLVAWLSYTQLFSHDDKPDSAGGQVSEQVNKVAIVSYGGNKGSGFWIDEHTLVTANHILKSNSAGKLSIRIPGNTTSWGGSIVKTAQDQDIVYIHTENAGPVTKLSDTSNQQGILPVTLLGYSLNLISPTVISTYADPKPHPLNLPLNDYPDAPWLVLSASTNTGMSGGPVLWDGKAVGMISWKLDTFDNRQVSNLSFAVPAKSILDEAPKK